MVIILSVLAAWILTSLLISLLSGAVIRRGMEGPQETGQSLLTTSNDPGPQNSSDVPFWSPKATAERAYRTQRAQESALHHLIPERSTGLSVDKSLSEAFYIIVSWSKCKSSWSTPSAVVQNGHPKKRCATSCSLYLEQGAYYKVPPLLPTSCR